MSICTPATIYAFITFLIVIQSIYIKVPAISIIFQIIFAVLWCAFLNFLCNRGYSVVSWVILMFPLLFFTLFFFRIKLISTKDKGLTGRKSMPRIWRTLFGNI
jgi:hypothetical protein